MSDTYCVLADIGIATQTNGHVSMCNQSRCFWHDTQGKLMTLESNTLDAAWQSPTRFEIQNALLSGQQHPNCQDCWHEEAAGRRSPRQIHNERFKSVSPLPEQPRAIILKPGNVCNLACRHCNPHTSSAWYKDYYHVEGQAFASITEFARQYDGAKHSYGDQNPVWSQLRDWSEEVVFWDLYGAEPLLIKPLIDLLRHTSGRGVSQQQGVHINTNGTIWHDDFRDIFEQFGGVDIGVSIDGIGRQFDYMRYPAKWDQIQGNLDRWQQLNSANVRVTICITVSLLNIYYLPEYMDFFHQRGWTVGTNLVHSPEHLNMCIADDATKRAVKDKLSSRRELHDVLRFLDRDPDHESCLSKFFEITRAYDRIRGQTYPDTFPEFAAILEQSHAGCWQ